MSFVVSRIRLAHAWGGLSRELIRRGRRDTVRRALPADPAPRRGAPRRRATGLVALCSGVGLLLAPLPPVAVAGEVASPAGTPAALAPAAAVTPPVVASAATPAAPARPMRWAEYHAQRPAWSAASCSGDVHRIADLIGDARTIVECARLRAPRDWLALAKGDETILVTRVRRPATRDAQPARVLFVNPGGPGVAADWLAPTVAALEPDVHRTHDIVAVDPRGTGGSSPVSCATLDDGVRDYRNPTAVQIAAQQRAVRATVARCVARAGARLARVNTSTTIRDHELVRTLLRAPTVDFYGVSAGTWMAARYADLYPGRVGRFVLDSNTQFTADWRRSFAWQPLGFQRRFDQQFLPWVARMHSDYGLGSTTTATRATYYSLRRAAARGRLGGMTPHDLDQVVVENLYTDTGFGDLAQTLAVLAAQLRRPTGAARPAATTRPATTAQGAPGRGAVVGAGTEDTVFMAVQCNDSPWSRLPSSYVTEGMSLGRRYPLLGYTWVTSPCAYWPFRPTPVPQTPAATRAPMLMVQSELDPATPLEGALAAHRARRETRLLTVDDQGNHGVWLGDNPCVERTVGTYLTTGRLPAADLVCPGMPLPGEDRAYPVGARLTVPVPVPGAAQDLRVARSPQADSPEQVKVRELARELFARAWSARG